MSENTKLDRRHDCNAGEYLPQRLTRVLDMENYWRRFQIVLDNDTEDFAAMMEAKKKEEIRALEEKKAAIKAGDIVLLLWAGAQIVKVDSVSDTGVKIGPHRYGWELVQKPSDAFLAAVRTELGGVV